MRIIEISEENENMLLDNYGTQTKSTFEKLVIANIYINKLRRLIKIGRNNDPVYTKINENNIILKRENEDLLDENKYLLEKIKNFKKDKNSYILTDEDIIELKKEEKYKCLQSNNTQLLKKLKSHTSGETIMELKKTISKQNVTISRLIVKINK